MGLLLAWVVGGGFLISPLPESLQAAGFTVWTVLLLLICIAAWLGANKIYIGPRGGRYRINSKGRKSYDVQ